MFIVSLNQFETSVFFIGNKWGSAHFIQSKTIDVYITYDEQHAA